MSDLNLIQLVEFPTWMIIINKCVKESLLDHIYVTDPTISKVINIVKPGLETICILPGNCKSLWTAFKLAKDNGIAQTPPI